MATTWVFERGDAQLRLQRQDVLGELRLAMWGDTVPERVYLFDDDLDLVACMTALDRHLLEQGWSLVDFFPERRSGFDRRDIPRGQDRRDGGTRYTAPVHDDTSGPQRPTDRHA